MNWPVPDPSVLALFAAAALAIIVVPGPSVLYVVSQSVGGGRKAGLVSTLGIASGALVHVAAATIGLSSLVASSTQAFTVVKYAGAAYLCYLGVRMLAERNEAERAAPERRLGRRSLVVQGALVEALNPKTALFVLAFLPQFVREDAGPPALQLGLLGTIFVLLGLLSDGTYALLAGAAASRVRARPRLRRYVSGGALLGLGVTAALTGHTHKR